MYGRGSNFKDTAALRKDRGLLIFVLTIIAYLLYMHVFQVGESNDDEGFGLQCKDEFNRPGHCCL